MAKSQGFYHADWAAWENHAILWDSLGGRPGCNGTNILSHIVGSFHIWAVNTVPALRKTHGFVLQPELENGHYSPSPPLLGRRNCG